MNLIIVDDSIQTVKALKFSIDWEKIGVSKVYTAYNISQAKEIICKKEIQIIICDIEMPQGSGIELIQWSRINSPQTENILLTCHAEFEYAKMAIELGTFDYLVKPIPFEKLESIIHKLILKIKASTNLKKHSEHWRENQKQIEGLFWYELITGKLSHNGISIEECAKRKNVSYSRDSKYLLILITKKRIISRLEEWEENSLMFALENIARDIILKSIPFSMLTIAEDKIVIIISSKNNDIIKLENIKNSCANYAIECNKYLGCSMTSYIGKFVCGEQLKDEFNELQRVDKNNISSSSKVIEVNSDKQNEDIKIEIVLPNLNQWAMMLHNGECEALIKDVKRFIDKLVKFDKINREVLYKLHQDILQMLYSFLGQKGIQAHQLFHDIESENLFMKAIDSIDDMISWVTYVFRKAINYVDEVTKSQTVIERIKTYVRKNYDKDITRDEIANYVFLNPDYLSRTFKKATGKSLSEYLTEVRIQKSKMLLISTNIQISSIATDVGYNNMNYFSKIFKKVTGTTPVEYRKKSNSKA